MTYQQCLDWLFSQLPMYQRTGSIAYKADIGNIVQATERLGNPHRNFKSIHIAGTNGKGSTSHLLASVLQEAGYKLHQLVGVLLEITEGTDPLPLMQHLDVYE